MSDLVQKLNELSKNMWKAEEKMSDTATGWEIAAAGRVHRLAKTAAGHIAELETLCREYSKAMMHHAGGGSEMFKTVAGEPYADPEACSKRISEGREHRQIINDKRIAELEAALKPFAELPANGGSGGPLVCVRAFYECELNDRAGKTRIPREAFNAAREALASTPAEDGGG